MRTSVRYRERRLAATALAAGAAFGCGDIEADPRAGRRRLSGAAWTGAALGLAAMAIVYFMLR